MLKFHGVIGRRRFFWASALRIGLFLASVPAQAFFLQALVRATYCEPVACNVVGLLGQAGYRWWVAAIFVFSFAGISMRRARDAGVPGWVGLFIPLLLAADGAFVTLIGEWSPRFALPRYVMLALACMVALCALPSRRNVPDSSNPFGNAGLAAFGIGLFVAANAAVTVVFSNVPVGVASAALGVYRVLIPVMTFVAMVTFVALVAWIVWRERGYVAPAADPAQSTPDAESAPHLPIGSFLVIALGITIATFYEHLGSRWDLALLLQPTTAVLPTLLLYFCPLAAVFLAVTRRSAASVALLVLALLPFGHWLYAEPPSSLPLLTTSGWYRGPTRA